jgi:hypothetical protein
MYLAFSNDFKLHIFNEHLTYLTFITLEIRLVQLAYFFDEES